MSANRGRRGKRPCRVVAELNKKTAKDESEEAHCSKETNDKELMKTNAKRGRRGRRPCRVDADLNNKTTKDESEEAGCSKETNDKEQMNTSAKRGRKGRHPCRVVADLNNKTTKDESEEPNCSKETNDNELMDTNANRIDCGIRPCKVVLEENDEVNLALAMQMSMEVISNDEYDNCKELNDEKVNLLANGFDKFNNKAIIEIMLSDIARFFSKKKTEKLIKEEVISNEFSGERASLLDHGVAKLNDETTIENSLLGGVAQFLNPNQTDKIIEEIQIELGGDDDPFALYIPESELLENQPEQESLENISFQIDVDIDDDDDDDDDLEPDIN